MFHSVGHLGRGIAYGVAFLALTLATSVRASDKYPFSISPQRIGAEHVLTAHNEGPAPVAAHIVFIQLDNAVPAAGNSFDVVIPAHSAQSLGKVMAERGGEYYFRFNYQWRLGDPAASQDPNVLYRLPFADGLSFQILQAHGGPLSTHAGGKQEWAVDIPMPVGTPIVAARAGYVAETVDGFGEGGRDPSFLSKANYVRILHDDGTFATYAHLLGDSIEVEIGERVSAGTPLGLSGNSGYTSGPHLHFAVEKNDGESTATLPFRFYSDFAGVFEPSYQQIVTSDYARESGPTAETAVGSIR